MILSRRIALGGVQLDQVDGSIIIQSIDEAAGKETISAVNRGSGNGQRITGRRRDTLDVTVRFSINKRTDNLSGAPRCWRAWPRGLPVP